MSVTQIIAALRQDQILEDSVRQQRPLVLTHNHADGWRTFKAVFADLPAHGAALSVRVDLLGDAVPTTLPPIGATLGATFRLGHKKCMFSTVLLNTQRRADHVVWTIRKPEQLQQLQRRAYERAVPPKGAIIAVKFWRDIPGQGAGSESREARHGQLEDISAGGMRIKVSDTKDVEVDKTYKCVFVPRPGKPTLVLEAVLRHREAADSGRASLGFQFVGLETTAEGLRQLDRLVRIVNHFHRSHALGGSSRER